MDLVFYFSAWRKRAARLLRRLVVQRRVWPDRVIVVAPQCQLAPRIIQAVEDLLVQQVVPEAAVEALDKGVLLRLARIDVAPWHLVFVGLFQDGPTVSSVPSLTMQPGLP